MTDDVQSRFWSAVDADARSDNRISEAAGLNRNYLLQLRRNNGFPKAEALDSLLKVLNLSPIYLFTGLQLDPAGEELLRLAAEMTPDQREKLLTLLSAMVPSA